MAWKQMSKVVQRSELVFQLLKKLVPVKELFRRFKISRPSTHKWRERYRRAGLRGLQDVSRRPRGSSGRPSPLWLQRVRRERLCHRTWGGRNCDDTRAEFARLFRIYGPPEGIRCDNGSPFGGGGPAG